MRRILAAIATTATLLMLAGTGVAAASTNSASAAGSVTQSSSVHPNLAGGNYQFEETNGSYYVGSLTLTAGNPVIENTSARSFTFTVVTTYGGNNAGYLQFSNGNFLAATTNCDGATIKSSVTSFGTVWAPKASSTPGSVNLVNRGCSDNAGHGATVYMAGRNLQGQSFVFCDNFAGGCSGLKTQFVPF